MKTHKIFSPVLGCAVLALTAAEVQADAWQKEPSYGVELGYNDNYTLQPEPTSENADRKIQSVGTIKAKAGFALTQLKPAFTARIEGKLIATSYTGDADGYLAKNPDPNGEKPKVLRGAKLDDRVDAAFTAGIESRRERSVWRFDASLLTDSILQDISLDVAKSDNQGEGIVNKDVDDGTVRDNVDRTRLTIAPSYLYRLSTVSYFRTGLSLSTAAYDNTDATDLKDFNEQKLDGFYSREFSPINSWSVDGQVRNYDADEAGQFDSAVVGVGLLHKFSETTDLGLRLAQSTTSFDYGETSGSASKPLIQLKGSKSTGRTVYSFSMGTDLYGSATGDVVTADELLFNAVYQYSELMTFTWRSKLFQNKSVRELIAEDAESPNYLGQLEYNNKIKSANRRYLAIEPTVNWRFSRWWVMDAGLRYQREKRDSLENPGESVYGFVGVTFSKPLGVVPEF